MRSRWAIAVIAVLWSLVGVATAADKGNDNTAGYAEGIEYERVTSDYQPDVESGQTEVLEFFWYGCPHCNRFDPYVQRWLAEKPKDVVFRRVAPALNPRWTVHSKAFYAAKVLEIADEAHADLFEAIHAEGRSLDTAEDLAAFYAQYGVTEQEFKNTMQSFTVDMRLRQANRTARKLGVRSVPTVVIDGQYRTDGTMAGSFDDVIAIIRQLTASADDEGQ